MTQLRDSARLAGLGLVGAGVLALVAALATPWSWRTWPTGGHPGVDLVAAMVALGPLASAVRLVWWRRPARALSLAASAAALGAGLLALLAVSNVGADEGIRAAGPGAVAGCAGLVCGWLLVAAAGPGRVRWGAAPVAGTVVALLAAGVTTGVLTRWYTEGRFVRSHPVAALPEVGLDPPVRLDRERWRGGTAGTGWTRVAGRYLLVARTDGLRALDAVTGQPRWSYRRTDLPVAAAGLSADGSTAVVLYAGDGNALAAGLDPATGRLRWQRRYAGLYPTGWQLYAAGDVLVGAAPGAALGTVTAFDAATGTRRWTWTPPGGCTGGGELAAAGDTLAVALHCPGADTVLGLSTVDGKPHWDWQPDYPTGLAHGDDLTVRPVGDGFLVGYGRYQLPARIPRTAVVLDAATGRSAAHHEVPDRFVAVAGRTALYVGARLTSVDLATGQVRWSRPLDGPDGWVPVDATDLAGRGYLLLRGPAPDGVPAGEGGPLRVLAVNLTTGDTRTDRAYTLGGDGCHLGGDGRRHCGRRTTTAQLAPGLLLVTEQPVGAGQVRLGALG